MSKLESLNLEDHLIRTETAPSALTPEMEDLAQQLAAIHGTVRISREVHGIHFYIASPECLSLYGTDELHKLHCAVNVEKYLQGEDLSAMCMKSGKPYRVTDLVSMQPLSARGYADKPNVVKALAVNEEYLEDDGRGNRIPKSPGKVVPVFQLPKDHPARVFLERRPGGAYDPIRLYRQFRLSYCEEERKDMYYRHLIHGFKATPQGRVIFYMDYQGVNRGWQARILELDTEKLKYYFHPYKQDWIPVMERTGRGQPWRKRDGWEDWDPVKYMIGHGARRNECLLGLDAAIAFSKTNRDSQNRRYGFLSEGPLDAGRADVPGMAQMGKSLGDVQADLLCKHFDRIIFIGQNDTAGAAAAQRVATQLMRRRADLEFKAVTPSDPNVKDLGELPPQVAYEFCQSLL